MLQATQGLSKSQKKRLKKKNAASKDADDTNGEAVRGTGLGAQLSHCGEQKALISFKQNRFNLT